MPSDDYLCLGGIEIANRARTATYARNGLRPHRMQVRDCACTDFHKIVGDAEYRLPALDPAPWVDPSVPESYEFAGLWVTELEGLGGSTMTREVEDRVGDGAVLGRPRLAPRTITVTGLLLGSNNAAMEYGLMWLSSALRGSLPCAPGAACLGDDLEYLTACPAICEDAADFTTFTECARPYWRTLREVGVVSAPTITGHVGAPCGCCSDTTALQVQFSLVAGRPQALRPPVQVVDGAAWDPSGPQECVTWSADPGCVGDSSGCAPAAPSCMDEALASIGCAPTTPPALPISVNPCACLPLVRRQMVVPVPSEALAPIWGDVVPDVRIYSGSNPLRAVRVRFFPNPLGRPFTSLDPCGYCAEINISIIPASSTVRVDGTARRVTVQCPGEPAASAGGAVTGTAGAPYAWPALECGTPYLAVVEADAATIADDAAVTLHTVAREY